MDFDVARYIPAACGIVFLLWLIPYTLNGIGLYGIAKKNNISGGWLAFMPFVRKYLEGKLAGEIKFGERTIENPGVWLFRLPIIFFMLIAPIVLLLAFSLINSASTIINNIDFIFGDSMDLSFFYSILKTCVIGFSVLFIISLIAKLLISGLTGLVRYRIHRRYVAGNKAVGHMLLGMFIPMYQIIYYLVLSGATPLEEESFSKNKKNKQGAH